MEFNSAGVDVDSLVREKRLLMERKVDKNTHEHISIVEQVAHSCRKTLTEVDRQSLRNSADSGM